MIVDLFAGPGGWEVALAGYAGGADVIGLESDADAAQSARNAGFTRWLVDVARTTVPPSWLGQVEGLVASPPCQSFSAAGRRKGSGDRALVEEWAVRLGEGTDYRGRVTFTDPRSALTLEPLRWALELEPLWLAFEQVPSVLGVWECYARVLREHGYSTVAGCLNAECFGVPQSRKRAFLLAHKTGAAILPLPTHSAYHERRPDDQDPGVLPWVSMAQALGWDGDDRVGFPRLKSSDLARNQHHEPVVVDGVVYRGRDLRPARRPAPLLTSKSRSWMRASNPPRTTVRPTSHPAPTILGSRDYGDRAWLDADGLVAAVVTVVEAAVLQGFDPEFPWAGTRTSAFRQIGNALPPPLAAAVLRQLVF